MEPTDNRAAAAAAGFMTTVAALEFVRAARKLEIAAWLLLVGAVLQVLAMAVRLAGWMGG